MAMFIGSLLKCTFYGAISTGIASAAYLHTLDYTRKRIQGPHISEMQNPNAPPVAIIAHPFVRHRLLWMKSHVEGMRALVYYGCLCLDRSNVGGEETEKWSGINDILFPIYRHYAAEKAFKVTEMAVKMQGRYGYFNDYPVHQFMRDIMPFGWWEGDAGANNLYYLTQLLGQRDGRDFANLLAEMMRTIDEYGVLEDIKDLALEVQRRVSLLGEMGRYFADCFTEGKALIPISNGLTFIHFMGDICLGWILFWQAGVATKRLSTLLAAAGIDPQNEAERIEFLRMRKQAAFYDGKVRTARYFIKNVLPGADGLASAMKSGDLSSMAIHDDAF